MNEQMNGTRGWMENGSMIIEDDLKWMNNTF